MKLKTNIQQSRFNGNQIKNFRKNWNAYVQLQLFLCLKNLRRGKPFYIKKNENQIKKFKSQTKFCLQFGKKESLNFRQDLGLSLVS